MKPPKLPANEDTITIGDKTYTFTTNPSGPNDIAISPSVEETAENFYKATGLRLTTEAGSLWVRIPVPCRRCRGAGVVVKTGTLPHDYVTCTGCGGRKTRRPAGGWPGEPKPT